MKKGYHKLILPDGTEHKMVVVHFGDDGRLLCFHPMVGEEPFVEWEGGILDLRV